jgi:hypothetical protein
LYASVRKWVQKDQAVRMQRLATQAGNSRIHPRLACLDDGVRTVGSIADERPPAGREMDADLVAPAR